MTGRRRKTNDTPGKSPRFKKKCLENFLGAEISMKQKPYMEKLSVSRGRRPTLLLLLIILDCWFSFTWFIKSVTDEKRNLAQTHQFNKNTPAIQLCPSLQFDSTPTLNTKAPVCVQNSAPHNQESFQSWGARWGLSAAVLKAVKLSWQKNSQTKTKKKNGNTNATLKKCGEPNPRGVCYFLGLLPLNVMVRIAREVTRSQMQQKHCHTRISSSDHTKKFCFRWDILGGCDRVRKQIR